MTNQEYQAVVRRFGKNFNYYSIPAYIRRRDEKEAGVEYHYPEVPEAPDKYPEWVERQLTGPLASD